MAKKETIISDNLNNTEYELQKENERLMSIIKILAHECIDLHENEGGINGDQETYKLAKQIVKEGKD